MSRAKRLRNLIQSDAPTILMEAHSGLSARLVEEAGFEAIWGSGLSIAASLGVRDCNEASWTQVLDVVEFMSEATSLPILLDGDTGYGNFNNVRRLIRKLEQREIAGVCLEDKLFPKANSFIQGTRQKLAEVDEFCGKLRAAKDTQRDSDFVVVARTEAFISGWPVEEALMRATAYAESGADAVLIHSKRPTGADIFEFMRHWRGTCPLVIVPTTYPHEPLEDFTERGIKNFIFANHCLRTVITALQRNLKTLRQTQNPGALENEIATVPEVFRLQNLSELKEAEKRYLPKHEKTNRALILAATQGDFGELVKDKPKCMLNLRGRPILNWHRDTLKAQGMTEIGVVRGFAKQAVNIAGVHYFDNDAYAETGELASLLRARDFLNGSLLIAYGDILYDSFVLKNLLSQDADIAIVADA
ncbi:MAG: phosphoenolpyruvate mutase, partial [Nannocystaceae bacterium]